jgi:phosphatidylserine decarboxylase
VVDFYEITGRYHSCHPAAVVSCVTPYSKNRRSVTIIDTDVEGGSRLGLVAMVEVVAMMIGDILQCYSENRYESPRQIVPGMMLRRGQPKSLFRPGSSVDVLIFQKDRIRFSNDIRKNLHHPSAVSRFSKGFGQPLIETEVKIRQEIARGAFYND